MSAFLRERTADVGLDLLELQHERLVLHLAGHDSRIRLDLLTQEAERIRGAERFGLLGRLLEAPVQLRSEVLTLSGERQEAQPNERQDDNIRNRTSHQHITEGIRTNPLVGEVREEHDHDAGKQRNQCDPDIQDDLRRVDPPQESLALPAVAVVVPERVIQPVGEVVRVQGEEGSKAHAPRPYHQGDHQREEPGEDSVQLSRDRQSQTHQELGAEITLVECLASAVELSDQPLPPLGRLAREHFFWHDHVLTERGDVVRVHAVLVVRVDFQLVAVLLLVERGRHPARIRSPLPDHVLVVLVVNFENVGHDDVLARMRKLEILLRRGFEQLLDVDLGGLEVDPIHVESVWFFVADGDDKIRITEVVTLQQIDQIVRERPGNRKHRCDFTVLIGLHVEFDQRTLRQFGG